ncbi:MAG: addiction module toxin RelE [Candidatus Diapherotrites archaeon CG08_land_8_20_14_0_20_34_12]|nr:MAG: addiction module toxin RelE [Candidatus Diapherotrites archaeon CG08_land_8_20_14_0_20_34_12]
MAFSFDLSDELKAELKALSKRDKGIAGAINNKIKQIITSDDFSIDHYKNLKYSLKEYKRVHIAKSFVLLFKVFKKERHILFDKFKHHDDVYNR